MANSANMIELENKEDNVSNTEEETNIITIAESEEIQTKEIPYLPYTKDFHLFICYNQENAEEVRVIVKNLEQLGLKCCYHERDFLPGQNVLGNINEAIERSVGILLVLSEDFVNSPFCSHEVEQALHARIADGYIVIPIMIELCNIPESLKYLSYIDARNLNLQEIHLKIRDAFIMKTERLEEQIEAAKNGLTISFPLTSYRTCWKLIPVARYKLTVSQEDRQRLWNFRFVITDEEIDAIEAIVSSSVLVKYKHVFVLLNRLSCYMCCMLLFLTVILTFLSIGLTFGTDLREGKLESFVIWVRCAFVIISFVFVTCMVIDGCGQLCKFKRWKGFTKAVRERAHSRLKERIWHRINRHSLGKFIAVFENYKLNIVKFDIKPCQELFVRRCERNKTLKRRKKFDETTHAFAKRIFEDYVRLNSVKLLEPSNVSGRHSMANGAKCLCHLVEDFLLYDTMNCMIDVV